MNYDNKYITAQEGIDNFLSRAYVSNLDANTVLDNGIRVGVPFLNTPTPYYGQLLTFCYDQWRTVQLFFSEEYQNVFGAWIRFSYNSNGGESGTRTWTSWEQIGSGGGGGGAYLPLSGGTLSNTLHIRSNTYGNHNEGIRIHEAANGYSSLVFCGAGNTGDIGVSSTTWGIYNKQGEFSISKNGITTESAAYMVYGTQWNLTSENGDALVLKTASGNNYCTIFYVDPLGSASWSTGIINSNFGWWNTVAQTHVMTINAYGVLSTTGDQVISSDETKKENLQPLTHTVEDIASARAVSFDWKDGHGHSAGSIAQDWKDVAPEFVHGEEGDMTLAYGQLGLVNSIIIAKEMVEMKESIKKLEKENEELKKLVHELIEKIGK